MALWSSCSQITKSEEGDQEIVNVGGLDYKIGKKLGEGGKGIIKELIPIEVSPYDLVIKLSKTKESSKDLYGDLLLHSSMEILGIPTTKSGMGYLQDENGERQFILIKERVRGSTLDSVKITASLKAFYRHRDRTKMQMAGMIYSRIINAGIFISDMHSRNIMWDKQKKLLLMIDGNIESPENHPHVNPKKGFGRAIGILGWMGDRIFYDRYYSATERAASEAEDIALARIKLFFASEQQNCEAADPAYLSEVFDIDANRIFKAD